MEKKSNPIKRFFTQRGMAQIITVFVGLIIICIVFSLLSKEFASLTNMNNLLRQIAPYLLVGVGQGIVLITGNIDLSIGSVLGMSCMMTASLMADHGMNPWLATLITLAASIAIGIVNGILVGQFKLPPFIATLGTMTIARGFAQWRGYNTPSITGQTALDAVAANGGNPEKYKAIAEGWKSFFYGGKTLGVYNAFWVAVIIWIAVIFLLGKTRTGRHTYAIGSNVEAAKLSGVNVLSTTIKVYIVCAVCSCVAGFMFCATTGQGSMDAGMSYEMYGVAAAVIGGISTLGGTGLMLGTIVGAAVWGVLQNGLQFVGAPLALKNILVGIIVVLSVLLDVIVRNGSGKFKKKDKAAKTAKAAK